VALAIDASSPPIATQTVGTTATVTTASFTPPDGSLLLVVWSGNTISNSNPSAPSITDNLGVHLTYTQTDWQSRADSPTVNGQAAAWWAPIGTGAAMTVTVTTGSATGAREAALKVYVLTGQDAVTPIGAHGKSGSASAGSIAQSYTAQSTGGWGFLGDCDWDDTGAHTAGSGCTYANGGTGSIPGQISYGFLNRTTADDSNGASNSLNVTLAGTSTNLNWVYVEVNPSSTADPTVMSENPVRLSLDFITTILFYLNRDYAANPEIAAFDQSSNVDGIPSGEVLGNAAVTTTYTINAGGIPSSESTGTPAINATYTIPASGIPSQERLGSPPLTTTVTVSPGGIPTQEISGSPSISLAISAFGIPTQEIIGSPVVAPGSVTISAFGITSSEVTGNANTGTSVSIFAFGIPSQERLGSSALTTTYTVNANGIVSGETLGADQVTSIYTISANGIPSTEKLGSPSFSVIVSINAGGIPSQEQTGTPAVNATYTINANGIVSSESVGKPALSYIIIPFGIPSSEAIGKPTLVPGTITIAMLGIKSGEALGTPDIVVMAPSGTIQAYGIPSSGQVGAPYVGVLVTIDLVTRTPRDIIYVEPSTTTFVSRDDFVIYLEPTDVVSDAGPETVD